MPGASVIRRAYYAYDGPGAPRTAGVVTAVAPHGKMVHLSANGMMDLEAKKAMTKDAIFRIASMTEPIVGVAGNVLNVPSQPPEAHYDHIKKTARK